MFQQRLASNYRELRNYEKAIAICQEMIKIDPKKGNAELIDTYRQAKQYDQAISLGKQLYEKGPAGDKDESFTNNAISYAHALADAGKAKEGAEVLNKLLQSQQENIDIYFHLSQIYLQGKRFEDAEKVLLRAENRKPDTNDFARLKFLRAEVYEKQKDFDRAESICREILRANPNNATALNYIGYMLADRGVRLDEALKYVQEALVIEPNNGAYLDSLGWAFFKMNDMTNAEKNLLKADTLTKNDPVINEHLGDLYSKLGNLQKAQEFYSRSIKIGTEQEEVKKVQRKLEVLQESIQKQKTTK
jgi:tetratricopeptide (TPR) repeat protein